MVEYALIWPKTGLYAVQSSLVPGSFVSDRNAFVVWR